MAFLQFKRSRPDLLWGRADIDRAPFKATTEIPLLKNEEFEALSERTYNCKAKVFCMDDPEDSEKYIEILDAIASGWYQLLSPRSYKWQTNKGKPVMYVYMEWAEVYMEIDPKKLSSIGANG